MASHQDRVSRFSRDGFVTLSGYLGQDEVALARALVESRLRQPSEPGCVRPNNTLLPLRWNDPLVQLLLLSERRMGALREAVGGSDLKWISGYISIKEASSPPLWWHQDWWCWDHAVSYRREASQIALLCYPADTEAHNGGLRVLPRTHLRSSAIHASLPEAHSRSAQVLDSSDVAMTDHPDQVTPNLQAGDAVVIDYRLLHGTHGNASRVRRDCLLLSFTPCWRGLPEDVRAHLIDHPALPSNGESQIPEALSRLLPAFQGVRRSLVLNRDAPHQFVIGNAPQPQVE
jgi:hypothetical protein